MCVELFLELNINIQKEFSPLSWVDITSYKNGTGSISFTDCGESEDEFFLKMEKVTEFINDSGYKAELKKFPADCDCPYSEVTIRINFGGNEMKDLVTDAILFYKMIGAANELAEKNYSNGDIMTVDYCNKIVELANKYGIECDDTMPYGILNAEDDLEKFFKSKLEEAVNKSRRN